MPGEEQEAAVGRQDRTVTVPEAAKLLGKSADAIRSALRRGTLEGYRDNQGEWRIPTAGLAIATDGQDDRHAVALDSLRQEFDRTRAELEQAQRQADDRQATVAELRERVARLEGEMAGVRATAQAEVNAAVRTAEEAIAVREELVAELRRAADHERARGDRLEAELRRPWWRRWRG
jgi:hypothetical protein